MKSLYVLTHHTRLRYAWAYDGAGSHEMYIIIASQFMKETTHSGRLYVETADTVARAKLRLHLGIFFDLSDMVYVDGLTLVLFDEIYGIFNVTKTSLGENIILMILEIFSAIHIKVDHRKSLRHHQ